MSFNIDVDPNLGRSIVTDSKRLQQVLKNLLSNAFKFTAEGGVRLNVSAALGGWSANHPVLNHSPAVIAFEVSDTGIGIPLEKQKLIFEAFQQADAGTSRKYGGTGLGLAISRELASLLGGENSSAEYARQGQQLHPVSAAEIFGADCGTACQRNVSVQHGTSAAGHDAGTESSSRCRTTGSILNLATPFF